MRIQNINERVKDMNGYIHAFIFISYSDLEYQQAILDPILIICRLQNCNYY